MNTSPRFKVSYYTDNELFYSSYLFTGLFDLACKGYLELKYRIPRNNFSTKEIQCSRIEVVDHFTGNNKIIAFDWSDSPRLIYKNKLNTCDYYFKRNLIPGITIKYCPPEQQSKIFPLGLTFACRSKSERPLWVRVIGAYFDKENFHLQPITALNTAKKFLSAIKYPLHLVEEEYFHPSIQKLQKPYILFHSRAYDSKARDSSHDSEEISQERAKIVRALRKEFGENVIAGFIPSKFARSEYPDLLVEEFLSNQGYIDILKSASICVYSRGLNDSPAFKLSEYLATGNCIVSQRIPTLLPKPLTDGVELAYFDSVDHLLDLCHRLLGSVELRETLRKNAFNYYLQEVSPAARIMKVINQVFNI